MNLLKQLIQSYFQVKNQYQPFALILDISKEVFVEKFNTSIAQRQRLYSKPYKTSGNIFNGNIAYIHIVCVVVAKLATKIFANSRNLQDAVSSHLSFSIGSQ